MKKMNKLIDLNFYKNNNKFNGQEKCELISYFWKDINHLNKTPEEIWNYSPTGELFMVDMWFIDAMTYYKLMPCSKCGEFNQIIDCKWIQPEVKEGIFKCPVLYYICDKCNIQ